MSFWFYAFNSSPNDEYDRRRGWLRVSPAMKPIARIFPFQLEQRSQGLPDVIDVESGGCDSAGGREQKRQRPSPRPLTGWLTKIQRSRPAAETPQPAPAVKSEPASAPIQEDDAKYPDFFKFWASSREAIERDWMQSADLQSARAFSARKFRMIFCARGQEAPFTIP